MLRVPFPAVAIQGADAPEGPVAIARPERVAVATRWFLDNFRAQSASEARVLYAVKANPSPWALDAMYEAGLRWFDCASEVEVETIATRFPDATIAFMHPVKSRRAIRRAYFDFGVRIFVLDCADELAKILEETGDAQDLTLVVRIAVSNEGASLPLAAKFGASAAEASALLRDARPLARHLGVSFHVGSQCMDPAAYRRAIADANAAIVQAGVLVDVVDVGGGFPAAYPGMTPPPMQAYVDVIASAFEGMYVAQNAELWCEPGRALVAEAGSILTRVDLRKGNMLYLNDGAYGNLFDATHVKWPFPVRHARPDGVSRARLAPFGFYGPTCDSIDASEGPWMLPMDVREGDWIEIGMLGAYGVAMATRFNGFGETITVYSEDAPWETMYVTQPEVARKKPVRRRKVANRTPW
jgi:ornithine decarboxylase